MHSEKPALLVYKDGRIKMSGRVFPDYKIVECEMWPNSSHICRPGSCPLPEDSDFPMLKRYFQFIGEAGPYAVYKEIY